MLASGQSQSANRLYDYVSSGQAARDDVIDGFLIHGGGEKTFDVPLAAPVLHLLSDLEADPAPPSDDPRYRLWEVAATAHSDYFIGYQSVFGNGPRIADQPAMDRAGYDDADRRRRQLRAGSRATARDLHRRRRDHAHALRHLDRAAPAGPLGAHR